MAARTIEGNTMRTSIRTKTAALATAAPANAVYEQMQTYSNYPTKQRCLSERTYAFQRIAATGHTRTAYTPCHYQDAKRKWMFQVWFI